MEAGAILGLARCDRDPGLAEKSHGIYEDLGLAEAAVAAEDEALALRHERDTGIAARAPRVITVVGVPGTGKSIVTRTAGSVLAEWGYDPYVQNAELIDRIRLGEDLDLAEVLSSIIKPMEEEVCTAGPRVVGIVKIPTGRLGELFGPWTGDRTLLEQMLCLRMHATPALLRTRNAQRRSGQLADETLEKMIFEQESQDPLGSLGYSTWESAFHANGGAMVGVDAAGSILALEHRLRVALALSYLPYRELVELGGSEGVTG